MPVSGHKSDAAIFIVKPISNDVDDVDWTGRLKDIKDSYVKRSTTMQNMIIHRIQQNIGRVQNESKTMMRTMNNNMVRIDFNQSKLEREMEEVKDEFIDANQKIEEKIEHVET